LEFHRMVKNLKENCNETDEASLLIRIGICKYIYSFRFKILIVLTFLHTFSFLYYVYVDIIYI
jgi:hypothetical protein